MIKKIILYLFLCESFLLSHARNTDELKQIKQNYRAMLIPSKEQNDSLLKDFIQIEPETEISDQVVAELHQRYPFDLKKLEKYINTLTTEGTWPDINYADTKRSGWEPKLHTERILELAKLYYSPNTPLQYSKQVKRAIHTALHYWFTANPNVLIGGIIR